MTEEKQKEFKLDGILKDFSEKKFTLDDFEYSIKEHTNETELENLELFTDSKGKVIAQAYKIFQLTNLQKVPYTSDHIKQVIGVEKEWWQLSIKQRFDFLMKFTSEYLNPLIIEADKALQNNVVEEEAKN